MTRSFAALAGFLIGLAALTACSPGPGPGARVPVTNQPVTNQPVTQGDHAHPGDILLTSADDGRVVTITAGQTVAAIVPGATSVFIADSTPEADGSPVPGGTTAVLNPLGGFRFRALGAGQAVLAAEYNCGIGASCAKRWLATVVVLPSDPRTGP